jgi:hypothetical protein
MGHVPTLSFETPTKQPLAIDRTSKAEVAANGTPMTMSKSTCKLTASVGAHQASYVGVRCDETGLVPELINFDPHEDLNVDRLLVRRRPGSILPREALQRMEKRAIRESWTVDDCYSATLQALLLTYRSTAADSADTYGFGYVDSAPEDYAHNCPWNDWNPPSKARLPTPNYDAVQDRVRVALCTSLDLVQSDFVFRARRREDDAPDKSIIAFASVEQRSDGSRVLCLRRGSDILASFPLDKVYFKFGQRGVRLLPASYSSGAPGKAAQRATNVPKVCLKFECDSRLSKFRAMVLTHFEVAV